MPIALKILTVTDLHRIERLYHELLAAVELHQPDVVALVGDFLDAIGSAQKQLENQQCAAVLARLKCQDIVFARGNHEDRCGWQERHRPATGSRNVT
jgi:predicted MPP superfamily phosphohydrolase